MRPHQVAAPAEQHPDWAMTWIGTSPTDSRGWALRTAGAEDAPAVVALWRAAGAAATVSDDPASVERLVTHDPEALIVAELDGEIVASLIAGFDGWRAHLYRLAVHPRLRRRGLARALVTEAELRLARRGARRVNALVAGDTEAVMFWEAVDYGRDPDTSRHVKNLRAGDAAGRP
jgi:ribosomal protein S18 acetylase RimI-like enzyme